MAKPGITRFQAELESVKQVGLDTMCFIYQFADHPIYAPLTHTLFSALDAGNLAATTSTVSVLETLVLPERQQQVEIVQEYQQVFAQTPHLKVVVVDVAVAALAAKLRAKYSALRTPDAIQLSAALLDRCEVFVTNDRQLAHVEEIRVLQLQEFVEQE